MTARVIRPIKWGMATRYDTKHRDLLPRQMRHGAVGMLVFMETHRRVLGGQLGKIPEPLKIDAFSMSGYCLDAPNDIPAGGMAWECLDLGEGFDPDDAVSVQLTVRREQ